MKFVCLKYPKYQMTFRCDVKKEVNGELFKTPAVIIQFEKAYYITEDKKQIAFLKAHADYGIIIHEVEEEKIQGGANGESPETDQPPKRRHE